MQLLTRAEKIELAIALDTRDKRRERARQSAPGGLLHFVRYFWPILEPAQPLIDGWPLWAMCQHLEAVSRGDITRLLINISPGSTKSMLVNVFWPAWEWSAYGRPDHRYLAFSYGSYLTERDNQRMLLLMESPKFRGLWGDKLRLTTRGSIKLTNNHRGWKYASSVGGVSTGERGSRVLADDLHNIADGESQKIRESTCQWFREAMLNRVNNMETSAIVVIMQRVAEDDVSGLILSGEAGDYVHLMIPMEYEPDRACSTYVNGKRFWTDPRTVEGECFWPERFPEAAVDLCKAQGDFAWNSQYQQRPEIRGGGLFKREYWQRWGTQADLDTGKYTKDDFDHVAPGNSWPRFSYILASLDPAFTSKQQNDPSGFGVWGCFEYEGDSCAILLHAWRKWLPLHGPVIERGRDESDVDYRARSMQNWGLVETIADDCRRFKVKKLLIENKASGHDVSVEMHRLFDGVASFEFVDPAGLDKWARAVRVQPEFSNSQIWARTHKKYAGLVIDEMAIFPKGKYDDNVDQTTQAVWWLRNRGFLKRKAEKDRERDRKAQNYKPQKPLYEC